MVHEELVAALAAFHRFAAARLVPTRKGFYLYEQKEILFSSQPVSLLNTVQFSC